MQEWNAPKPRHSSLLKIALHRQIVSCFVSFQIFFFKLLCFICCDFILFDLFVCFSRPNNNLNSGLRWSAKDGDPVLNLQVLLVSTNCYAIYLDNFFFFFVFFFFWLNLHLTENELKLIIL